MPRPQVSVVKRQREQAKRERQQRKAEKKAQRKAGGNAEETQDEQIVAEGAIVE